MKIIWPTCNRKDTLRSNNKYKFSKKQKTYFESLFVEQWLGLRDKLFKLPPPVVVEDVDVLRWFVSACPWRGDIGVDGTDRIPNPMLLVDL